MKDKTTGKQEDDRVNKAWKEGYEAGARTVLGQNQLPLKLGSAILDILDERYEFKNEYYD